MLYHSPFLVPRLLCFSRPGQTFTSRNALITSFRTRSFTWAESYHSSFTHCYFLRELLHGFLRTVSAIPLALPLLLARARLLHGFLRTVPAIPLALPSLATYSIRPAVRLLTAQLRSFHASSSRRPRQLKLYACKTLILNSP